MNRWASRNPEAATAARMFEQARTTYERSDLPERPDHDAINQLCVDLVSTARDLRAGVGGEG
jgi:hypothetical protein